MNRAAAVLVLALATVSCTGAARSASPDPATPSSPVAIGNGDATPTMAGEPTSAPISTLTPEPMATPWPTPLPTSIPLPDGLADFAWINTTRVLDATGAVKSSTIAGGPLGSSATFSQSVPWADGHGFTWTAVYGDIGVATYDSSESGPNLTSNLRLWRASDGSVIGNITVPDLISTNGFDTAPAEVDVARSLVYVAVRRTGGGVDIRRMAFDGSHATTVVQLDARFTSNGIPTERYTYGLDPSGTLLVLACAHAGGCRLWEIEPDAAIARAPRTLAASTPIVCDGLAASERWLVVSDDDVCTLDYGEAPFPMRAIDRRDGTTHSLGNESQLLPARVVTIDGREVAIAAKRSADWSTSSVMTIDLQSGAKTTVAGPFRNGDQVWLGLDPIVLPGAWVLVEPWGSVDAPGQAIPPGRLVNVGTRELIQLPQGTFGWR